MHSGIEDTNFRKQQSSSRQMAVVIDQWMNFQSFWDLRVFSNNVSGVLSKMLLLIFNKNLKD